MLSAFIEKWNKYRVALIMFMIFYLTICYLYEAYGHVFDIEVRTPEWESVEREVREKEGREALDRVERGTANDRDWDRAIDYVHDHQV